MITCQHAEFGTDLYRAALALREDVLRRPLGRAYTAEDLAEEPQHRHYVALDDGTVVGAVMMIDRGDGVWQLRQMAISPDYQGKGAGAALVRFAESAVRALGATEVFLNAREGVVPFYRKLGYTPEDYFVEIVGIPNQRMRKTLGSA